MTRTKRTFFAAAGMAILTIWAVGALLITQRDDSPPAAGGPVAITDEPEGPFRGGSLPDGISGASAPRFSLRDARGGTLSTAELQGSPYLVTFLYTDCDDVCPLIGQEIKQALEQLGDRGREITAVAVTADPDSDTAPAVRRWLSKMQMPDNFRYLIGSRRELMPIWKAHYAAPQPHDRDESAHSASIWLVDHRGRWRTKFSGGVPVPPQDIAHDLRILLDESAQR